MADDYAMAMLKPQDIVVLCKLAGRRDDWTISGVGEDLGLAVSAVHRSLARAEEAHLYGSADRLVKVRGLQEFIVHSARYLFPAAPSGETRGIPTAWSAQPLAARFAQTSEPSIVWAHPQGKDRGSALEPIHPSVPEAALKDPVLYERLALIDALRIGGARVRREAAHELSEAFAEPPL